jgi:hypothetical protein
MPRRSRTWSVSTCDAASSRSPTPAAGRSSATSSGPVRTVSPRVFLQKELFGPEEYRQIVAHHYGMARHHLLEAQTYGEHAKMRYGLQLLLFSEGDGEM